MAFVVFGSEHVDLGRSAEDNLSENKQEWQLQD